MVVVGTLAAIDLWRVQRDVRAGRAQLTGLQLATIGDEGSLEATTRAALDHLDRADRRAHDSPWLGLFRPVPVIGAQVEGVRDLTSATRSIGMLAQRAADALAPALEQARHDPAARVELADGVIEQLAEIDRGLAGIDVGGGALLPPVSGARDELVAEIEQTRADLARYRRIAGGLRRFLAGPSRYVVLAANNAEMTAGSGMPLSGGVATIEGGEISLGEFVHTDDWYGGYPTPPLPDDLATLYAPMGIGADWRGTTATPNFPTIGHLFAQMAAQGPVGPVDGVFVVDAVALQQIVAVTGPVVVDGIRYDAGNVVDEVLNRLYVRAGTTGLGDLRDQREEIQGRIAAAVFDALETREIPPTALAAALADAARGRHLLAWSDDDALQTLWRLTGAAGPLRPNGLVISVENYDGNKLDYYIRPQVTLDVEAFPSRRRARLSVEVTNPARVPLIVQGPDPRYHFVFLDLHLPAAATDISLHGADINALGLDGPMKVVTSIYFVPVGETVTVTAEFSLPSALRSLTLLPSARLAPIEVRVGDETYSDDVAATIPLPRYHRPFFQRPLAVLAAPMALAAAGFALSWGLGVRAPTAATGARPLATRFDRRAALVLGALAALALLAAFVSG